MTTSISTVSIEEARGIIASCVLGDEAEDVRVGDITLHPHQRAAVVRIRRILNDYRGALLCDDVGLGKTYVALATAAAYKSTVVVAPACLGAMWRLALAATRVQAEIVSIESLGRSGHRDLRAEFVIVDEAHHFRNPCTRRYAAVATLCIRSPVLLLSATPIHNSRDDVAALVALFWGSRAFSMTDAELARVLVRRDFRSGYAVPPVPVVEHVRPRVLVANEELLDQILHLPPPVPPSDGSIAARLVIHGLVRQWVSSNAALVGALRRRIARSHALLASLEAGRYPTATELSAWVCSNNSVQLAFAELLDPATIPLLSLTTALRCHVNALEALLAYAKGLDDDVLARFVCDVRFAHPGERIVVFSCYAETAESLYRQMKRFGHAALLTARGAVIASGPVTREEVIAQFRPRNGLPETAEHARIDLLIATDVMSEGVNLHEASVVIHLDIPWTHARLQQRVGRLARIGSRHQRVMAYTVNPPPRAEGVLREMDIVARKLGFAVSLFGDATATVGPNEESGEAVNRRERIRAILERWRADPISDFQPISTPCLALVHSSEYRALGVWLVDGTPTLLACDAKDVMCNGADVVDRALAFFSSIPTDHPSVPHSWFAPSLVADIEQGARKWYEHHRALIAIGEPDTPAAAISALDPRKLLSRVADRALAASHFARRTDSAELATRLRNAAATPLPVAVEWSLESLGDVTDEASVNTILELVERSRPAATESGPRELRCVAIIISPGTYDATSR